MVFEHCHVLFSRVEFNKRSAFPTRPHVVVQVSCSNPFGPIGGCYLFGPLDIAHTSQSTAFTSPYNLISVPFDFAIAVLFQYNNLSFDATHVAIQGRVWASGGIGKPPDYAVLISLQSMGEILLFWRLELPSRVFCEQTTEHEGKYVSEGFITLHGIKRQCGFRL